MSKFDLEKILNLKDDVRKLESRKLSLETDIERLKKEVDTIQAKSASEIEKNKQEFNTEVIGRRKELNKSEADFKKREETIALREKEQEQIALEWERLKEEKQKLSQMQEAAEKAKVNYLNKTHLAELREEQLKKEIEKLGVKPEEPEVKPKKKK